MGYVRPAVCKGEAQKLVIGLVVGFIALSTLLFCSTFSIPSISDNRPARCTVSALRGRMGNRIPIGRHNRGVPLPRLFAPHTRHGNRLLASRSFAFCLLRRHPSTKHWRRLDRRLGHHCHRIGFCFQPVAHRQPLVRGGLARIVGLGRELLLRSSRQRLQSGWNAVHLRFAGSKWITGGSVGPEGSVLAFVIVIAMALTIHFLYPKRQWRAD